MLRVAIPTVLMAAGAVATFHAGELADTDLRLARYFGVSEGMFLGLQADNDLMERKRKLGARLAEITPRAA